MCAVLCFFNDTATTEISTLSLHDALPISPINARGGIHEQPARILVDPRAARRPPQVLRQGRPGRSEEHTSELQSRQYLVCRLLLEKTEKRPEQHTSDLASPQYLVCRMLPE